MWFRPLLALPGLLLSTSLAGAVEISFSRQDLPDAPSAPDRWLYTYALDAFPYEAGHGFSVLFDPALYGEIDAPAPVGAQWDVQTVQPEISLPDEGLYDAQALVDTPSALQGFRVSFVWLGEGVPGAQPFEVYDPVLATLESGLTLPEPGVAAQSGAALLALAALGFAAGGARW